MSFVSLNCVHEEPTLPRRRTVRYDPSCEIVQDRSQTFVFANRVDDELESGCELVCLEEDGVGMLWRGSSGALAAGYSDIPRPDWCLLLVRQL